eukprot:scaffold2227_cov168-Amphora_coffeaeformis.AAC.1
MKIIQTKSSIVCVKITVHSSDRQSTTKIPAFGSLSRSPDNYWPELVRRKVVKGNRCDESTVDQAKRSRGQSRRRIEAFPAMIDGNAMFVQFTEEFHRFRQGRSRRWWQRRRSVLRG